TSRGSLPVTVEARPTSGSLAPATAPCPSRSTLLPPWAVWRVMAPDPWGSAAPDLGNAHHGSLPAAVDRTRLGQSAAWGGRVGKAAHGAAQPSRQASTPAEREPRCRESVTEGGHPGAAQSPGA